MPLNKNIKKVLVIGSGPIVIGQAAEFDYAGTQACRALREDGIEIVLLNSNPATIMTDKSMADRIYIEPMTLTTVKRIIQKEKPDSILSGLGGQTGLNLCMQLAKEGFLEENGVTLLGVSPETIDKAEDRQLFKDTMESINQPCIPSKVVTDVEAALEFAEEIGYPVIVRPAFTLGGTGGGIADDAAQLSEIASVGLSLSPITQVLIEKCISGWKEIEFEVMRDSAGNAITVCSMENFDPVGVHTGDSIVVAPAVTLSPKEYQMLRTAALDIVSALGVEGGCNCQFALHPQSFEYAVIEVNPRVSRSSALASKATGYPIAKVATKVAIGYRLDEIVNSVTGTTYAAFEPAIDYIAVKFPKWPFDKFVYAKKELGTQMKATGEVMSIDDNFEGALMKAVRGAEIGIDTLNFKGMDKKSEEKLFNMIKKPTDLRLFAVYEALKRGITPEKINEISKIDKWFLYKLLNIVNYEKQLGGEISEEMYFEGKKLGFLDGTIGKSYGLKPNYKMVDTCACEYAATTPYFYATYDKEEAGGINEAVDFKDKNGKKTILVLGSGPIRIGQGIEFDYASVHCIESLQRMGYEVAIINNNPETVSTDFDTADRLYFEPLCGEDVMNIINFEKPEGVVVAFGGGTAIKLTKLLSKNNIPILGTSADSIDAAEDRERFEQLLESLNVKRPKGFSAMTTQEALEIANKIEYPVLIRPSYVLGGQNMIIAYDDNDIKEYMEIILRQKQENPILIDKYINGYEIEVDAICDGEDILIPGIMEHIERTGIHSGDSIAVYPPQNIDDSIANDIFETTKAICLGLGGIGLVNIQYIVKDGEIYVIEVNPRASRTVPYMSKITGIPMCDIAMLVSLGTKLRDTEYGTGLYKTSAYTAVKVPVFSFEKLTDVDTQLGPEMKSTGEVLGIGKNLEEALYKGLLGAGYKMSKTGGVFLTVRDSDKEEIGDIAEKFSQMGFLLYATAGTARVLEKMGLRVKVVNKIHESEDNSMTLLDSGSIKYIVSTSKKGRDPVRDSVKIRRKASLLGIPCLTSIDTANALANTLMSKYSEINTELVDITHLRAEKINLKFTKMQGCGNDYIYIDCFKQTVNSPENLSVFLTDRHFGIGGDGVVLICPSEVADAKMRVFNVDGSEGEMAGTSIRCVAKYLYDNKMVNKDTVTVETKSGVKTLKLKTVGGLVSSAQVNMGLPTFSPKSIPMNVEGESVVNKKIEVCGKEYEVTALSFGNPHAVVFMDNSEKIEVSKIGPQFENCPIFPEKVNAEFVQVLDNKTLRVSVWERGNGETLACGTGACAAVVAAVMCGHCEKNSDIKVMLLGGELTIRYTDEGVFMTGPCEKVFEGIVTI